MLLSFFFLFFPWPMLPWKDEKEKENRLFISAAPSSSSLSVEGQTSTLPNRPGSLHVGVRTSAIDSAYADALIEFDASLRDDVAKLGTVTAPSHVDVRGRCRALPFRLSTQFVLVVTLLRPCAVAHRARLRAPHVGCCVLTMLR